MAYLNAPKWSGKSLAPDPDRGALVTKAFEEFATGRFTKEEVLDTVTRLCVRIAHGIEVAFCHDPKRPKRKRPH